MARMWPSESYYYGISLSYGRGLGANSRGMEEVTQEADVVFGQTGGGLRKLHRKWMWCLGKQQGD